MPMLLVAQSAEYSGEQLPWRRMVSGRDLLGVDVIVLKRIMVPPPPSPPASPAPLPQVSKKRHQFAERAKERGGVVMQLCLAVICGLCLSSTKEGILPFAITAGARARAYRLSKILC